MEIQNNHPLEEENPLMNKVILETMFKIGKFSIKDFRTYRQVCKLWYNISLDTWRKNTLLPLSEKQERGLSMRNYLQLLDSDNTIYPFEFKEFPYRNYNLSDWDLNFRSFRSTRNDARLSFWEQAGPNMQHLDINKSMLRMEEDLEIILKFTTNLVFLKLEKTIHPSTSTSASQVYHFPGNVLLEKLTTVELNETSARNLSFIRQSPNLEFFKIHDGKNFEMGFREIRGLQLSSLREFTLSRADVPSSNFLRELGMLMQNLEKLQIGLNNDSFPVVCRNWRKLRSLIINPFRVDEDGMLGIQNGRRFGLPNITHLKDLEHFVMMIEHGPPTNDGFLLTPDSLQGGILSLPKLVSGQFNISLEAVQFADELIAKCPNAVVSVRGTVIGETN